MIVLPNTYMLSHKVSNQTTHPVARVSVSGSPAGGARAETVGQAGLDLL